MTVERTAGVSERVLAQVVRMLLEVTGEDERWAEVVTPEARLEGDLRLESVELLDLADRLRDAYGESVDLPGYYAGLDIDEIVELTVGDVVDYVTGHIDQ
jgi:acyl carrier protein